MKDSTLASTSPSWLHLGETPYPFFTYTSSKLTDSLLLQQKVNLQEHQIAIELELGTELQPTTELKLCNGQCFTPKSAPRKEHSSPTNLKPRQQISYTSVVRLLRFILNLEQLLQSCSRTSDLIHLFHPWNSCYSISNFISNLISLFHPGGQ